jgi:hypothetical protein
MSATMKSIKLILPCQMTTEEFATKSQEYVDWANDQARREAAVKALKDQHKLPIKLAKDKQLEIRETLNTKTVAREVECFQVFNWETNMTHQRRGDTGEMVPGSVRKMTKDEMQMDQTQTEAPSAYLMIENIPEAEVVQSNEPLALPAPAETSELQNQAVDGEISPEEAADIGIDSDFEVVDDEIGNVSIEEGEDTNDIMNFNEPIDEEIPEEKNS